MSTRESIAPLSRNWLWFGRGATALVVLFLLFDSVIKMAVIKPVVESFQPLGYPVAVARSIGIIELACLALYVIPRTSVLGAILLTALFGGGIASHVRLGDPLFTHILFGVYLGVFVWGGLFLRNDRGRALIPLQR